jgi:hypothetical protein
MDLFDAASFFDDVVVTEVGTTNSWEGQLDVYDDSKRDGLSPVRRIFSTTPEVPDLVGKIIQTGNKFYIVGIDNEDQFMGEVIRRKYVLQQAQLHIVGTLLQCLRGEMITTYLGRVWTKDKDDEKENSDLQSQYQFLESRNSSLNIDVIFDSVNHVNPLAPINAYLTIGRHTNTTELVSNYVESVGTNSIHTVSVYRRTYNLVTDKNTDTLLGVKFSFVVRYKLRYHHLSAAFKEWEEGDLIYFLEYDEVPTIDVNDIIVDSGTTYRIVGKRLEGGVWALHCRL